MFLILASVILGLMASCAPPAGTILTSRPNDIDSAALELLDSNDAFDVYYLYHTYGHCYIVHRQANTSISCVN